MLFLFELDDKVAGRDGIEEAVTSLPNLTAVIFEVDVSGLTEEGGVEAP